LANDEMAEIILIYPEHSIAVVACLSMNNIETTVDEIERAVENLKFRGIRIASSINGEPLDPPGLLTYG